MRHNMWSPRLGLHAIVLAASLSTQAHATIVNSASASIDQLQFRLIDLDPNDGVTPSIQWVGGGLVGSVQALQTNDPLMGNATGLPSYQWVPGTGDQTALSSALSVPLSSALVRSPSGEGGLSVSGSSLQAKIQLDSSQLKTDAYPFASNYGPYPDGSTPGNVIVGLEQGQTLVSTAGADLSLAPAAGAAQFVLSANTLLLVEGSAHVGINADYRWLAQYALDHPPVQYQSSDGVNHGAGLIDTTSNSTARLELSLNAGSTPSSSPDFVTTDQVEVGHLNASFFSLGTYSSAITANARNVSQEQAERTETFSLALVNSGQQEMQGVLGLTVNANAMVGTIYREGTSRYLSVPEGGSLPGVPEPSSWLLMGLGLSGVARLARRQMPTPRA